MRTPPHRIVSLLASGTELVCALGAGDRLVGRSHECDHPSWVERLPVVSAPTFDITGSSRAIDERVRARLAEGGPLYRVDAARIAELAPDLVITQTHCEVCAVSPADLVHAIEAPATVDAVAVSGGTLEGILRGFRAVAAALDLAAEGEVLVAGIEARMDRLRARVRELPRPTVICLEWLDPVFAMGNWGPELVDLAGGTSLLGAPGEHSASVPWEAVLDADPDVLVIAPCGFRIERTLREIDALLARPGYRGLRAVKNGRVHVADGNLYFNRSGPSVFETAEILAEMLHPESFPSDREGRAWVRLPDARSPSVSLTVDAAAEAEARRRQASLTKPPGSLGAIEELAVRMAGIQGGPPASRPAETILFAADHPIVKHGVSAYPATVTAAMVENFLRGGAAASVLSRSLGVGLTVVDVGVGAPYARVTTERGARLRHDPVASCAEGDARVEDAMTDEVFEQALAAGRAAIDALDERTRVVMLGEMGIGNSTLAAAVAAAILGGDPDELVGRGTGVGDEALLNKKQVVREAVARIAGASPRRVLQAVGGREIAAIAGAAARAAERRMVVLVDGFIVSAAILALVRMEPDARNALVFAHCSAEPGHARVLRALDARPLLDLGLRLGEASGALAALPLLDLACALHHEMATFASAGVPDRAP